MALEASPVANIPHSSERGWLGVNQPNLDLDILRLRSAQCGAESSDRNRLPACPTDCLPAAVLPGRAAPWQGGGVVLCLLAALMGIHTSISKQRAYGGVLTLTRKQVPHQQRGGGCLLRRRLADSSHWPQSPQMRR